LANPPILFSVILQIFLLMQFFLRHSCLLPRHLQAETRSKILQ